MHVHGVISRTGIDPTHMHDVADPVAQVFGIWPGFPIDGAKFAEILE